MFVPFTGHEISDHGTKFTCERVPKMCIIANLGLLGGRDLISYKKNRIGVLSRGILIVNTVVITLFVR